MLKGNTMKNLFLILFCVSLVLFFNIVVSGKQNCISRFASALVDEITVEQVLDNYVKALGGKEALLKITSRTSKGTYSISATTSNPSQPLKIVDAPLEIYAKSPNKIILKINISKTDTIQRAFDGTEGWAKDLSLPDIRSITGTELSLLKTKADFYWSINLKTLYPQLTFKEKKTIELQIPGKLKLDKKEVYVLEAKQEKPASEEEQKPTERFYFDVQTGLLLRSDIDTEILIAEKRNVTTNGNTYQDYFPEKQIVPIEIYYENYKEIDGVKIPMTTRQAISTNNIIINLTTVENNKPIDDKLFTKPIK